MTRLLTIPLLALALAGCNDRTPVDPDDPLAIGVDGLDQRQGELDVKVDAVATDLEVLKRDLARFGVQASDDVQHELAEIEGELAAARDDVRRLGTDGVWEDQARKLDASVDALGERVKAVQAQIAANQPDADAAPDEATADEN